MMRVAFFHSHKITIYFVRFIMMRRNFSFLGKHDDEQNSD